MARGHIELDRRTDSIRVGERRRGDLGDLGDLIASISELGLLQPITISPDGTLVCGARRLEAVKRLGWTQVNVWVRSGISTLLEQLLAEQQENTLRKALTPTEEATLYRELKALIAEDAARRQRATRFGAEPDSNDGPVKLTGPCDQDKRTSRAQAAQLVTGRNSYNTLERVGELQHLAADPSAPDELRQMATEELAAIDSDGIVYGRYQRVKARQDELAGRAEQALARVRDEHRDRRPKPAPEHEPGETGGPRRYGVRAFLLTWGELRGWADHYDPAEIGPALSAEQWAEFEATAAATAAFAEAAREARET